MTQSGTAGDARVADRLMFLMIALQERANRALVEELHDGPMQELTAVLLSLASLRRGLPAEAAARITQIETRLRDAATALHRPPPPFRPGNSARQMLELGLIQRVEGVLVDRLYTSLDIDVAPPVVTEVAVVLATVQLLLQESDPLERPARALVAVRTSAEHVELALRVAYADGGRSGAATAGRLERLRQVADVLGVRLSPDSATSAWSAAVRLPRAPSPAGQVGG